MPSLVSTHLCLKGVSCPQYVTTTSCNNMVPIANCAVSPRKPLCKPLSVLADRSHCQDLQGNHLMCSPLTAIAGRLATLQTESSEAQQAVAQARAAASKHEADLQVSLYSWYCNFSLKSKLMIIELTQRAGLVRHRQACLCSMPPFLCFDPAPGPATGGHDLCVSVL